ncbi:transcription factor IBH1-like 1 [Neltuma alba]|uniref:transcription factor IBH1-like 1 n=1 Tax=Neltuma alba TaxID=207710 RepID=UPI0010A2EC88|nr:transcription factor IBH1-like 1 [Prosopis alba]
MRNPSSVKREFLRKWIKGLGKCRLLKNNMSFLERKKAIKLSADLAMASTRSGAARWSRALIAEASSPDDDGYNKILTEHIFGSPENQRPKGKVQSTTSSSSLCRSRRILKRSRLVRKVVKKKKKKIGSPKVMANWIAKRLVKKRTKMLKSLLPGGESMDDDVVLIEETLDYVQYLRAQVEVMRCLATASELTRNS